MTKFNEFEAYLISEGLKIVQKKMIKEIRDAEKRGKRHIFAETYPPMVVKEAMEKVVYFTKKSKK